MATFFKFSKTYNIQPLKAKAVVRVYNTSLLNSLRIELKEKCLRLAQKNNNQNSIRCLVKVHRKR